MIVGMGGRVPDEMRAQLKRIITAESSIPVQMHYLEYAPTGNLIHVFDTNEILDTWMHGGLEIIHQRLITSTATSTIPCTKALTEARISLHC